MDGMLVERLMLAVKGLLSLEKGRLRLSSEYIHLLDKF